MMGSGRTSEPESVPNRGRVEARTSVVHLAAAPAGAPYPRASVLEMIHRGERAPKLLPKKRTTMMESRGWDPVTVRLRIAVSIPGRWAHSASWFWPFGTQVAKFSVDHVARLREFHWSFEAREKYSLNRLGCAYAPRS